MQRSLTRGCRRAPARVQSANEPRRPQPFRPDCTACTGPDAASPTDRAYRARRTRRQRNSRHARQPPRCRRIDRNDRPARTVGTPALEPCLLGRLPALDALLHPLGQRARPEPLRQIRRPLHLVLSCRHPLPAVGLRRARHAPLGRLPIPPHAPRDDRSARTDFRGWFADAQCASPSARGDRARRSTLRAARTRIARNIGT